MASKRIKYSSLMSRRHTSLQQCLDSRPDRRRCYKNWITVVMCVVVLHYTYTYYLMSDDLEAVRTTSTFVLANKGDEYLTTIKEEHFDFENLKSKSITNLSKREFYIVNITYKVSTQRPRKLPKCVRLNRYGRYEVNTSRVDISALDNKFPLVKEGGFYQPPNCTAKHKVAIIVPYRARESNLGTFLYNMHPFLMQQQLQYQIFIIEQYGTDIFNKGRLFNAGFKEVRRLNKFHCVIFHDLDLLPKNLEILYTCPTLPRHMCPVVDDTEFRKHGKSYKFKSLFGGVVSMTMNMFERANGYSNLYFGWGGEDNDMFWRLRAAGFPVVRYNKTVGVYIVLPHTRAPTNEFRFHLLIRAVERYKIEGISNLDYEVKERTEYRLYTHILVDINPLKENIKELTLRWTTGDF